MNPNAVSIPVQFSRLIDQLLEVEDVDRDHSILIKGKLHDCIYQEVLNREVAYWLLTQTFYISEFLKQDERFKKFDVSKPASECPTVTMDEIYPLFTSDTNKARIRAIHQMYLGELERSKERHLKLKPLCLGVSQAMSGER